MVFVVYKPWAELRRQGSAQANVIQHGRIKLIIIYADIRISQRDVHVNERSLSGSLLALLVYAGKLDNQHPHRRFRRIDNENRCFISWS